MYILTSGTAWLSDTETDGSRISMMAIASSFGAAFVMIALGLASSRCKAWLHHPATALYAGLAAALGSAAIIFVGPYYGQLFISPAPIRIIFIAAGVLFGAGLGVVGLHCGMLYSGLPPRRAIVQTAYAEIFVALSFFVVVGSSSWAPVPGGPSLMGIFSVVVLPVCAGYLAYLGRYLDQAPAGEDVSDSPLPASFWKLIVMVAIFSFIVVASYARETAVADIKATLEGTRVVMLLRMAIALSIVIGIFGTERLTLNFGKIYTCVIIVSVALVSMVPLIPSLSLAFSQIAFLARIVFEFFLWCTLAFVVFQRHSSPCEVFGLGFGAHLLSTGVGWLFGYQALTGLYETVGSAFTSMAMAITVLACAFLVFTERDFESLFASSEKKLPSLDELMKISEPKGEEKEKGKGKGKFGRAIDELSERYRLSQRERELLRCLALGYSNATTAEKLSLALNTVRTYRQNLYAKMGIHTNQELIALIEEAMGQKAAR